MYIYKYKGHLVERYERDTHSKSCLLHNCDRIAHIRNFHHAISKFCNECSY